MTPVIQTPSDGGAPAVSAAANIRDAFWRMDADGLRVVIVVDDSQRVVGHVTLETIGRHLRSGGDPTGSVGEAMIKGAGVDEQSTQKMIPFVSPCLDGNELKYLKQCIDENWVSSAGPFVERLERAFADFVGHEHALATSSGTTALHLALLALGIGPGDEVIVPDFTFAAPANAVIHVGATPVLVDVSPETWTIDVQEARKAVSSHTRAILPVHLFGQPAHLTEILALAREYGLLVIEDAAEALGSTYDGGQVGGFGDAAIFSFFGNKLITTGEGGMAVFRSPDAMARASILRDHGMRPGERYWHDIVGFNYRMTNMQAAIGCAQLERVEEFVARKLEICAAYCRALAAYPDLILPAVRDNVRNTYWLFTLLTDSERLDLSRDQVMARLGRMGIETRRVFYPLHAMPPYQAFGGGRSFNVSTRLSERGLSLPTSVTLSDDDVARVAGAIGLILDIRGLAKEHGL